MAELSSKKFLIVVTAGGFTNAGKPKTYFLTNGFSIWQYRHTYSHTIEFGTLEGQDHWLTNYPFISKVHILGPSVSLDGEEAGYLRMSDWGGDRTTSWDAVFDTMKFLQSSWPAVYHSLSTIIKDPRSRPDFIFADYLVDAVLDMNTEYGIPIAMHWPQMPTAMLPAPYVPGPAGLQVGILSSEYATIWQRLRSELILYFALPYHLSYRRWLKKMRASAGVERMLPVSTKPNYLCLVNSFFGIETPRDLPPNVSAIGPILSDTFPSLTESYSSFLAAHKKVLYVALGTHVLLRHDSLYRIILGFADAIACGTIDGVIWSMHSMARKQLDASVTIPFPTEDLPDRCIPISALLANQQSNVLFTEFAPQRALLIHPHIRIFLTHAGSASTNEAVFAGIPTITLGVYFDQKQNSLRLRDAGVSIPLCKDSFRGSDLSAAITQIIEDGRDIIVNCKRLKGIAAISSQKKFLAADLIEEVLIDYEGRMQEAEGKGMVGRKQRAMHLETADVRMRWWKARNWDLWAVVGGSIFIALGTFVALPVMLAEHLRG